MRTRYARWSRFTPAEDVSIAEIRVSVVQHAQRSHDAPLLSGPDLRRPRRGNGRRDRARTACADRARADRGRRRRPRPATRGLIGERRRFGRRPELAQRQRLDRADVARAQAHAAGGLDAAVGLLVTKAEAELEHAPLALVQAGE